MKNKKQVGIWIRVSTDGQVKDESPEHHERRARLYAEANEWEVVEVYRLEAMSGKSVMDYPQTKKMLQDIKAGRITGLIFSKLARLARNTKELLEFADIFRDANAHLISLQEAIDTSTSAGRMFYTMIAALAQWEREEIAARVAASIPIRAKMGKPLSGKASFGYKWDGKQFAIDEQEAPIRKLIYELFLKHKRKKTVATELNKMGYRTRNKVKFSDTAIARLLRDSSAKGERVANFTTSSEDKKSKIFKPQSEWVITSCPAIVSAEVWDECSRILAEQEKQWKKPGPKPVHLLSGFVHCDCGRKMYVFSTSSYYQCKLCGTKIGIADIDEIFHEQLKSFLLSDSDISNYLTQSNELIREKEKLFEVLTSEGEKLRKETDELVHMRMRNEMTADTFQKYHFKPQEERLLQIERQLPELQAEIDFYKVQLLSSDTVIKEANDLYSSWSTLEFDQKRTIVETITEKISIGKEDINIALSYLPAPNPSATSQNTENSQPNVSPKEREKRCSGHLRPPYQRLVPLPGRGNQGEDEKIGE